MSWQLDGRVIDFRDHCQVMGILNMTPDSFYDGGRYSSADMAADRALEMEDEGADIIDIGGESTRPPALYGSVVTVESDEECGRVIPVIEAVRRRSIIPISIDTTKEKVARQALDAGADVINDISAMEADPGMVHLASGRNVPVILMHDGERSSLSSDPARDVRVYLQSRVQVALQGGVKSENIAVDPGLGFCKGPAQNLILLKRLQDLVGLGCPILIGASRKSFIWKTLESTAEEALEGSLAVASIAILRGAKILRVHDVKETVLLARMIEAIDAAD